MTGRDQLFEHVVQRAGRRKIDESLFDFLARGGRQGASEIREWMEQEWNEIPCWRKSDLGGRLRSKDFKQFIGAYFELQVHCLLRRLGVGIEIEPSIPGATKKVDFRCTADSAIFFVEARVSGMKGLHAKQNLEDMMRKITEGVSRPHSYVDLGVQGQLKTTLARKFVVDPVLDLLNKWTADDVRRYESNSAAERQARAPIACVSKGDWRLTIRLRAVEPGKIGSVWWPSGVDDGVVDESMKEALEEKAAHWRDLGRKDEIVLIAINVCDGIFGLELEEEVGRVIYNGVLGRANGLEFAHFLRGINGVIVFNNATLGNERIADVKLYRNGREPIPDCLKCLLHGCNLGLLLALP